MTVAVEQEKEMAEFGSESNNVNPSDYSCQVLLERTTLEAAKNKNLIVDIEVPTDDSPSMAVGIENYINK